MNICWRTTPWSWTEELQKRNGIGQLNIAFMFLFDIYGIFLYSFYAGEGICGRKPGALTQEKIKVLCRYYARAIWSNTDVGLMRKAVYASIHHCYSTDAYPQHQYCPEGADSWCFYKRGIANGDNMYDHSTRIHHALDFQRLHRPAPCTNLWETDRLLSPRQVQTTPHTERQWKLPPHSVDKVFKTQKTTPSAKWILPWQHLGRSTTLAPKNCLT